jgi:hypothetical protein
MAGCFSNGGRSGLEHLAPSRREPPPVLSHGQGQCVLSVEEGSRRRSNPCFGSEGLPPFSNSTAVAEWHSGRSTVDGLTTPTIPAGEAAPGAAPACFECPPPQITLQLSGRVWQ